MRPVKFPVVRQCFLAIAYTYADAGRLHTRTWARGVVTTYGYTNAGDLETTTYSDSTPNVSYTYNRLGQIATVTDAMGGPRALTYTVAGQLTTEESAAGPLVTQLFDAYGRPTRTQVGGASWTHFYQAYYHSGSSRINYIQSSSGPRVDRTDGSYWTFGYDDLGQVTSGNRYWTGGVPVEGQQFGYGFDDIGNRTEASRDGRTAIYHANLLNQIEDREVPGFVDVLGHAHPDATVTVNLQNTTRQQDGYFHKALAVDNSLGDAYEEISVVGVLPGAGPNGEDVISEEAGHAFLPEDPEAFVYDLDGNLKKDGRWEYFWDGENRLTAMEVRDDLDSTLPRWRMQFTYDYMGRRVQKTMHSWDDTQVWNNDYEYHYVYRGWNLLAELDGDFLAMGPRRSYVWGLDLSGGFDGAGGVGGLLVIRDYVGGKIYFPSYDGNGNVIALTDAGTGSTAAIYEYGPFGETIRMTGPAAEVNPFRFSTKYQDEMSDLYYYGYRYYSPGMGRFLNRDPIEEAGGLNLYAFVGNNPVNLYDRLGRSSGAPSKPQVILAVTSCLAAIPGDWYDRQFNAAMFCGNIGRHCMASGELPSSSGALEGMGVRSGLGDLVTCLADRLGATITDVEVVPQLIAKMECVKCTRSVDYTVDVNLIHRIMGVEVVTTGRQITGSCSNLGVVFSRCCYSSYK